ncbi:MAG: hypothetical protein Q9P01_20265 [Anaerolineae bacterium]|nr:hypothetical protein [Anaerolineae bacterium]MDQ7037085.1 hypothetical protein [Anaerolineae bacterium]
MTNNDDQQNQRVSPFSRTNNNNKPNNNQGKSSSRFGSKTNTTNNQNTNSPRFGGKTNQNSSSSRFGSGSRFNRFGQQAIYWTIAPMTDAVVRISLDGLGDPFHRLLGTSLKVEFGSPEKVVEKLQSDKKLLGRLTKVLDKAWKGYKFEGAALLFPWDDDVRKAYIQPVHPNDSIPKNNNQNDANNQNNDDDDDLDCLDSESKIQKPNVTCLRAIDLAFVLNILARSRANVVVANTPLALEPGFLSQTVVCDDSRIVALARATGCIDEKW